MNIVVRILGRITGFILWNYKFVIAHWNQILCWYVKFAFYNNQNHLGFFSSYQQAANQRVYIKTSEKKGFRKGHPIYG